MLIQDNQGKLMIDFYSTFKDSTLTDSRLLADDLGVTHKSLTAMVKKNWEDFQEFGSITVSKEPINSEDGKGKTETVYLLNNDQVYYAVALCKNTEKSIECKIRLVKAFSEVRRTRERLLNNDITLADEVIQGNNNPEDLKWITARIEAKISPMVN